MLSAEGQASIDARKARDAWRWDGDAPKPTPGARNIGTVGLIGVGVFIWCKDRATVDGQVGGLVVDEWRAVDPETGELGERQFLAVESWRSKLRWRRIGVDEVDPDQIGAPDPAALRRMARAIWGELAAERGQFDSRSIYHGVMAMRLVDAVMGGAVRAVQDEWSVASWRLMTGE